MAPDDPVTALGARASAERLGSPAFRAAHGVRLAYAAGSMAKGIAAPDLVIRMAKARLLSWYGAGGQRPVAIRSAVRRIAAAVGPAGPGGAPWGVNLLHPIGMPELEDATVDLFLEEGVREVEAAAYIEVTPSLVRYRLTGLRAGPDGLPLPANRVLGKASRLEVAEQFLSPPPPAVVAALRDAGRITAEAAALASRLPLADDVCAEADSAGHTDRRVALVLLPSVRRLRDASAARHGFGGPGAAPAPRVGLAGGLGSPEALAAAFAMGADFVLTGSINQCTVEAATSDAVKDLLARAGPQDMDLAPAGDMFEIGARVQVLRRGLMFGPRANQLYELWRRYDGLDDIPPARLAQVERQCFGRSVAAVWEETRRHYADAAPHILEAAERNPKQKLAMVLRWYWIHANRLAMAGDEAGRADWQVHCGPAMGAFNDWVRGTPMEDWRSRHADEIAAALMTAAARLLAGEGSGRHGD
ncbi:MAG: PfaD family polyunsaturated fatty acid/polyketide biosynthesis protein [Alphaproteobacteria bacterium]